MEKNATIFVAGHKGLVGSAIVRRLKEVFLEADGQLEFFTDMLELAVKPLHLLLNIMESLSPETLSFLVKLKLCSCGALCVEI